MELLRGFDKHVLAPLQVYLRCLPYPTAKVCWFSLELTAQEFAHRIDVAEAVELNGVGLPGGIPASTAQNPPQPSDGHVATASSAGTDDHTGVNAKQPFSGLAPPTVSAAAITTISRADTVFHASGNANQPVGGRIPAEALTAALAEALPTTNATCVSTDTDTHHAQQPSGRRVLPQALEEALAATDTDAVASNSMASSGYQHPARTRKPSSRL